MSHTKTVKLITRLEIQLPSTKTEYIDIYNTTDPDKTAYNFSIKHNLSFNTHQNILTKLKTALNNNNIIPTTTTSTTPHTNNNYITNTNNIKIISTQIKRKRNISQSQSHNSFLNINTRLLSNKKKLTQSKSEPHSLKLTNIYERGISFQQKTQSKLKELQSKLNESDDEINTFSPLINPISKKANIYRTTNNKQYNNKTTISHYNKYLSTKLEQLRLKHADPFESENNSFKPNINTNYHSKSTRSSSSHRLNELYLDYKRRINNQETLRKNIESIYSFKPSINHNINLSTASSSRTKKAFVNEHETCHDRLYNYAKIYNDDLREKYHTTLYTYTNYNVYTSSKSNDIVDQKKTNIAKELFKLLDNDEDGIISRVYVDTRRIPKDVLQLILPIINEMKNENETLTEHEFVNSCLHLYQFMSYQEKKLFLSMVQYNKGGHCKVNSESWVKGCNKWDKGDSNEELFKKRKKNKILKIDTQRCNGSNMKGSMKCNNKSKEINFNYTPITNRVIKILSYDQYVDKIKNNSNSSNYYNG